MFLEHQGVLERDTENSYLQLDGLDTDDLQDLHGHSSLYLETSPEDNGRFFDFSGCLRTLSISQ